MCSASCAWAASDCAPTSNRRRGGGRRRVHPSRAGTAAVLALCVRAVGPAAAHGRRGAQGTRPPVVNVVDTGTRIEANRIAMFVTNIGSFAFDLGAGNSGLEFPKGTGNTAVFAAGLWLGAKVGATPA